MRILFVASGSAATVHALAPLATAARSSGHEVLMAAHAEAVDAVTGVGLPAVALTDRPLWEFFTRDRAGGALTVPDDPGRGGPFAGRAFGRMAAANIGALLELARAWRPRVVVGGTMSYAAGLLGARLGVPVVRQAWDISDARPIHPGADEELRPELRALGLDRLPAPDLEIDICPPSLRPAGAPAARSMRWTPGNGQRPLKPWMYVRGERTRVCLTAGSRASRGGPEKTYEFLRDMTQALYALDVELVVAAPDDVASELRAEFPAVRAGWFPLDVVAATLDLVVHHGGGVTMLTAMNAGVPQLIFPNGPLAVEAAGRLARHGASRTLLPGGNSAREAAVAAAQLLSDPSCRQHAGALAREMAGLPRASELVHAIECL
ncbi:glycosyltransferase [Streptomyces sp. NPDC059639]|uniref:glycosyltransferase n=1 Tax=Streptomyces sp. NPDC059639 TaxID=3346891 RepID=UPI0036CF88C0